MAMIIPALLVPALELLPVYRVLQRNSELPALMVGAAIVGAVMATGARPLYGLLEGYEALPQVLGDRLTARHVRIKHTLLLRLDLLEASRSSSARVRRQLAFYPSNASDMAPTRFGNAIETARGHVELPLSPDFLSHLRQLLPTAVRQELRLSQVASDFAVAMAYLIPAYGAAVLCLALTLAVLRHYVDTFLIMQGVVALVLLTPATYRLATSAAYHWITVAYGALDLAHAKQASGAANRNIPTQGNSSSSRSMSMPSDEDEPTASARFRDLHIHMPQGQIGQFALGSSVHNIQSQIIALAGDSAGTEVGQAMKALTDAALTDESMTEAARRNIVEHYEDLAEAANQPPEERRMSRVRAIVAAIPPLLGSTTKAIEAWNEHGETMKRFFGLQ